MVPLSSGSYQRNFAFFRTKFPYYLLNGNVLKAEGRVSLCLLVCLYLWQYKVMNLREFAVQMMCDVKQRIAVFYFSGFSTESNMLWQVNQTEQFCGVGCFGQFIKSIVISCTSSSSSITSPSCLSVGGGAGPLSSPNSVSNPASGSCIGLTAVFSLSEVF